MPVDAARQALPEWDALGVRERARRVRRLLDLITERAEDIAVTITRATGKPRIESYSSEIFPVAYLIDHFTKKAPKILQPERVKLSLFRWPVKRSSRIEHRPVGVVAIISPWNYPFSIPMGEIVLALLAGCTVVLKPSEFTPEVGRLIDKLCQEAGLPVWVVQGDGRVGAGIIDAGPDKIFFTGGTATGRRIMEAASKHLIPVVLELGGKDPMIVLDDAHLENAARAAVWGCFTNSGQVCASVKRIFVMESVADHFTELVVEKTNALRAGDPMDPDTDIGALIHERHREMIEGQVRSAVEEGARLATGGERLNGTAYRPTVFTDVRPDMKVAREEIFGPVLPILRVPDEDEAVRLAVDSPFGLTASVFGSEARAIRVARRLKAGTVMINDCTWTHAAAETPWGGVGHSGFGRTHGAVGLMEFTVPFHINVNHAARRPSPWWYPYDESMLEVFRHGVRFVGTSRKFRALRGMMKNGLLSRIKKTR